MESIWTKTVSLPAFPPLEGDHHADVAVIGGGLAGMLTAAALAREGAEVIVLEANRLGTGQTAGTTAKLTAQHGLKYRALTKSLGPETAGQYARCHLAGVEHLRRLVKEWSIDCDFRDCTAFLYAVGVPGPLEEEYEACRALGMDVFLTRDTELPFSAMALGLRNQARFHPLKLLSALAEGVTVYEHSRVLSVEDRTVRTQQGSVTAGTVIFTCHYPFINVPGYYFARQHQERAYMLALEGVPPLNNCYLGVDGDRLSLRPWGQTLLLGGGVHRTGENREGGKYALLERAAHRYWPQCRITARWSAQDAMPMDGMPYLGVYAESRPHWLVATGFQKWGMSTSVVAAEVLRDLALGRTPPADTAVFSPQRFHAGASARQLAEDMSQAVRGLSRRLLTPGRIPVEDLPDGHGGIVEIDGENFGVYRDQDGQIHAVPAKCPHLGCQLEWNPDELSWDCPCHGSRFDVDGRLLEGPAQTDL